MNPIRPHSRGAAWSRRGLGATGRAYSPDLCLARRVTSTGLRRTADLWHPMRGVCWIFCLLLLLASDAAAQSSQPATQPATQPVTRFTAIDIFVDPQGQPRTRSSSARSAVT
jgi:hypothetical protein